MKKLFMAGLLLGCFTLAGCSAVSIGYIPDQPPAKEEQLQAQQKTAVHTEVDDLKLIRVNGALYYETGEDMDAVGKNAIEGELQKVGDRFSVPTEENIANFGMSRGWKTGRLEHTIEVLVEDDWEIFKKLELPEGASYQFGYKVEGRLPNTYDDSEFLVLANTMDVSVADAASYVENPEGKDFYAQLLFD